MQKDAYRFALPLLAVSIVVGAVGWHSIGLSILSGALFVVVLWIFYFFRDPHRNIPADPDVIVSPADGKVVEIVDELLDSKMGHRISIFLNIFNVHVQRAPVAARVAGGG